MQYLNRILIIIFIFLGAITFAQSETSWIKKKSDKDKKIEILDEKKEKTTWIKKKIKQNKNEYIKEEKKITKEVKSWIKKKTRDEYLKNIDELPDGAIYFTGTNQMRDMLIYGYVAPDINSKFINGYYETSKGFGYLNDGKTTCKIGSTVLIVVDEEVTARVSGKCTNGMNFVGNTTQNKNSGWGSAKTKDGKDIINFDFNIIKTEIAKIYNKSINFSEKQTLISRKIVPNLKKKIILEPNGKYYALLIGNSIYKDEGWDDLVSPVNDIRAIKNYLDDKYYFEKIISVENGTKREIYDAFKQLSKLSTTNDYVLVYYSGHGQVKAQRAYWIPTDGSENWGNGDWINISELDIFLTEIKAHHLAVLVDSCFVGSKFKGMNIIDDINLRDEELYGESLESALTLRSRSVLSSGTSGQVSDTVAGTNHSMFALSLLNQLQEFDKKSYPLNLEFVASLMKINYRGSLQKPHMYHPDTWQHGGGDFIFIPKKNIK